MVAFCAEFGHGAYLGGFQGLCRLLETDRRISNRITVDLARRRLGTDSGGHAFPTQVPAFATDATTMIWSLDAMERKIQHIEGVLVSRGTQLVKMQQETADLDDRIQSRKAELANIENEVTINETKMQTVVNEVAQLKRHYKLVKTKNAVSVAVGTAESDSLGLEILELKREQRKLERTRESTDSIRSFNQLAASALKRREESALCEIESQESRLKVMESERKRVSDEIQALKSSHEALLESQEGLLKVKKEALDNAEKSLLCLKDQHKKSEQTNNAKLEKLLTDRKMAAEEITELQMNKKSLQSEISDLKSQVQCMNCEIRSAFVELKKVQTELTAAESRLDLLKTLKSSMGHLGIQTEYQVIDKTTQSNDTTEKTIPNSEKGGRKSSTSRTPVTSEIIDSDSPRGLHQFASSTIESGGAESRNLAENNHPSNHDHRIEGLATKFVNRGKKSMRISKYVTDVVLGDVYTEQDAASLEHMFLNLQEEVLDRQREAYDEERYNFEVQCAEIREHVEKEICRIVGIKNSVEKQAAKWEITMAKERKSQADTLASIRAEFICRQNQAKEEYDTSCKEYKRSLGKLKDEKARLTTGIEELKVQLHKTRKELLESETQLEENISIISHHEAERQALKLECEELRSESHKYYIDLEETKMSYENNQTQFEDDCVSKADQSETEFDAPKQDYDLMCANYLPATAALDIDAPKLAETRQAVIEATQKNTDAKQPPELADIANNQPLELADIVKNEPHELPDLENNRPLELAVHIDSQVGAKQPHEADRDMTAESVGYSDKEKLLILQRSRKRSWMAKKLP